MPSSSHLDRLVRAALARRKAHGSFLHNGQRIDAGFCHGRWDRGPASTLGERVVSDSKLDITIPYGHADRIVTVDEQDRAAEVSSPRPASVAAVVVTFHPEPTFASKLATLLPQVGAIIVVDNGSCPTDLPAADDPVLAGQVEIIANAENRGIGAALNQGLRRAKELGFAWALTLDQDSSPLANLVAAGGRAFEGHPKPERLAAIGASVLGAGEGGPAPAAAYRRMKAVITSGTLQSIPAWERLGGFREDYFIDCVDSELCLRARSRGFEIIQATEPAIAHRIGMPSRKWVVGRWMIPTNHSPLRRYYVTRNRMSLWRSYARSDGRFVATDMRQSVREWIGIAFAESNRPAKLRAILAGLRDALLGRYGPRRLPRSPH